MTAISPPTANPANPDTPAPAVNRPAVASRFTSGTAIILYVALARLVLYFLAAPHYGYFRDELYYLACGQHPAWGYVDQPPLIAWIAWLLEQTIGTSIWALRLLPALAGVATVLLAGQLARELGGGRWAMFLAALAALMAPIFLALSHLFTMNAFDPPLWTAIAWLIVLIGRIGRPAREGNGRARTSSAGTNDESSRSAPGDAAVDANRRGLDVAGTGNEPLWLAVGALAGISILNKYAILFWLSGLLVGVCLTPLRESLRHRWFWLGCAIAALIALPNFLWEWRHQFPFLQLMHNVRHSGRDIVLPPLPYLGAQAQMLGFVAALLVLAALLLFFSRRGRAFRALGWAYLVFLAEMMLLHGKMYYLAPVYPMMFAAGAAWIERATQRKLWIWAKPALALAIAVISGIYLPTILPVLSVPHFLAYEHAMGIEQQKFEHTQPSVLPQIYADMFGWQGMAQRVAAYYHTLSPEEQRTTAICADDYGEAGAIDFFGPRYGLPKAISGHQTYWLWGPRDYTGESMIVLGESDDHDMKNLCTSYSIVGHIDDPLSLPNEWFPIYHCRGLHPPLPALWPQLKHWR
jgi:4-amino-4-deoxy-L-arabinose transferase-like glycosyltransferase